MSKTIYKLKKKRLFNDKQQVCKEEGFENVCSFLEALKK